HLTQLEQQLAAFGITLLHLKATDFNDQSEKLTHLYKQIGAQCVYANSEPEVDEQARDHKLISSGLNLKISNCDVMLPLGS
ncbi:deoxyribodipyrimidine photo-lyase, partial [Vibrio sp. 10N.222.55.E8]